MRQREAHLDQLKFNGWLSEPLRRLDFQRRYGGFACPRVVGAFWTASYRERGCDLGARAALSCFQQLTRRNSVDSSCFGQQWSFIYK